LSNDHLNTSEKITPELVTPDATQSAPDDAFAQQLTANKQRGKWGRFWKGLGLTTLLGMVGSYFYVNHTKHGQDNVQPLIDTFGKVVEARQNPDLVFEQARSNNVNILLIGRDVNWKISKVYDPKTKTYRPYQVHDESTNARSDTMIVVSLDKTRNTMRMVSFPRDARVYIPENPVESGRHKLNAAHAFGGIPLLKQTLHDELGLTIHHHAVIKFDGFKNLIDRVGGIYIDVIGALHRDGTRGRLKYDDNWGNLHIDLKPGKQWLNGEQAHAYVRFRMDVEGDPGRIRRQQGVMRALAQRLKQLPPWQLPGVVKEIRQQFETDMDDTLLASTGFFAQGIDSTQKIQPITLFGIYGSGRHRGSLVLNKPKNEKLLAYIFGPTFNPDNFLQRSPWTRGDEISEESLKNPDTYRLLVEAGVIKDDRLGNIAQGETSSDASLDSGSLATIDSSRYVSRSSSLMSDTATEEERPRRRRVRRERREEVSTGVSSASEDETPRRRRARRERREESTPSTESSTASSDSAPRQSEESPIPQPEQQSSAPEAAAPVDGSTLNVESPIPRPE
jgi:LCP family protein required for cell wall assembly